MILLLFKFILNIDSEEVVKLSTIFYTFFGSHETKNVEKRWSILYNLSTSHQMAARRQRINNTYYDNIIICVIIGF
jgi:hypothetical protein